MQEIIINSVLAFVVLMAMFVRFGVRDASRRQKTMMTRILISSAMLLGLQFVPSLPYLVRFGLYFIAYLIIGYDILRKACKGILNRQIFDENFLMAVATIGAMVLAVYENGDYIEAIAVMLFYQIGEWFQSYAVGKSRRNISELMDIRPDYANIECKDKLVRTDPASIKIGDTIVVNPGEKVPIDGVVLTGHSSLNTSSLTGESMPRTIVPGDVVISGCINMTGMIKVKTTKDFGESTVSKILDLVENASSNKSKSENFISKFARIYTPAVCYAALSLAVFPPVYRMFALGLSPDWGVWIYRALTFLVISCPCALVISIPLSFFAGIGGASRQGILIKGSNYLEILSHVKTVVFDKTGTLTQGVFVVNAVHHNVRAEQKLIEYAALTESASSHPVAKSLQHAYGKTIDRGRITDIQEISGHGIIATVDGMTVVAGNDKLMKKLKIRHIDCHQTGTIIHMAIDGKYEGHIVISDVIKPMSCTAIAALRANGIQQTVMLTGDATAVANVVAEELKIDQVYSNLLPADKVAIVENLLSDKGRTGKLAFVGDGINDAPVLSRADIGIAMGACGSDAAIEAADIVIMDDDPLKIATAMQISKKCLRIVYQNIILALGVKAACLLLGAFGIANMYMAIFADVGVMILTILNAIRCLFIKK
ncbi:MAG: cadmium-translocating P-type ATPase [Alphaproteobacteria bacterium]|nr:cadmium-translocating P-type ATPase [Alphaproteobacteria bacterium]